MDFNNKGIELFTIITAIVIVGPVKATHYDFEIVTVDSFGSSTVLECNNTSWQSINIPANHTPVGWMLPNLEVVRSSDVQRKYEIINNNWTLQIFNITTSDFGYYHCILESNVGAWYLTRIGLNVLGPFFTDTWDSYRVNVFHGAAGFVGFVLAVCLVSLAYKYRWLESSEELIDSIKALSNPQIDHQIINAEYNSDGVEGQFKNDSFQEGWKDSTNDRFLEDMKDDGMILGCRF